MVLMLVFYLWGEGSIGEICVAYDPGLLHADCYDSFGSMCTYRTDCEGICLGGFGEWE